MAAALVQSKAVAVNVGDATNDVSWDTAATSGGLLIIGIGSDDYLKTSPSGVPSGFTQPTGSPQETFLGGYLLYKVAAGGETTATYEINSAATGCWISCEWSGISASAYNTSAGQKQQSSGGSYTTPAITPSAGEVLLIALIGGSSGGSSLQSMSGWTDSFTEIANVWTTLGSGTRDSIGMAYRVVTADGVTSYSTGATWDSAASAQARVGIIAAFNIAAAAATVITPKLIVPGSATVRAATW